ncbi:MAG TPA: beta-ketoacyl-[acyl-carrier-protein] synthase family protein [Pyrinomonadaceae bacterium]|jgi:3-oxoacyl-[acyl-carrier-protein] synthase II|nr:beta-ketoacyl-[acyl-carrier-protein] synthase family protein [Pyrinomonadaceae bacterium]
MKTRVVVTGLGVVTSVGAGREQFWEGLLSGRCGISVVESFDTSAFGVHRGGEVKNFDAAAHLRRLDATRIGRASQFAAAAARMALADAGVEPDSLDPLRAGVSMGTTSGEPLEVERFNDSYVAKERERIGPEFIGRYPCHLISANVAEELGFAGVNVMIPTACAAGNHAVAHAFDVLRSGRADLMLAGGSDAFSRITYTGFARLGAVAPEICQPFDRKRKGMIPGEGAGVLVLEPLKRAVARGARIYAEVAGYGLSCDAHHMTAAHPEGDGAARAMSRALGESGMRPEDVSYVSAHGTGTPTNDRLETIAVKRLFQEHAYRVPVSSVKSMLGHTMGAASAIEAAVCALAVHTDRIPPTINLEEPDPECDLDYVPNRAREHTVNVAMNNAYAFGGNNASLVLKKCEV